MFGFGKPSPLELVLVKAIAELGVHDVGSQEFVKMMNVVSRLQGLIKEEKSDSVSKDTMLVVGANLLGILMVIRHENVNVITTRALSLITKPRVV